MKTFDRIFSIILIFNLSLAPLTFTGASSDDENVRTNKILDWEEVNVKKGFILSNHLYHENYCINIWDKQIPEFIKQNPHIKNPDNIAIGSRIKVQRCYKKEALLAEERGKDITILDEHRVEFFGGLFKERNPELGLGMNVFGAMTDNLGYRMFFVGAPSAMIYFANAEFRTKPAVLRYYLSAGLGQRIGLGNKQDNRIEDGVDSFVHSGVGIIYQPRGTFYWKAEAGLNLSPRTAGNFEISGMKKFKDFWLGGFFQLKSTRSINDNLEKNRDYIFTGVKVSF